MAKGLTLSCSQFTSSSTVAFRASLVKEQLSPEVEHLLREGQTFLLLLLLLSNDCRYFQTSNLAAPKMQFILIPQMLSVSHAHNS